MALKMPGLVWALHDGVVLYAVGSGSFYLLAFTNGIAPGIFVRCMIPLCGSYVSSPCYSRNVTSYAPTMLLLYTLFMSRVGHHFCPQASECRWLPLHFTDRTSSPINLLQQQHSDDLMGASGASGCTTCNVCDSNISIIFAGMSKALMLLG